MKIRRIRTFFSSPRFIFKILVSNLSNASRVVKFANAGELKILTENEISSYYKNFRYRKTSLNFRDEWARATFLAKTGKYHEAVVKRKDVMVAARKYIGADLNFIPSLLESDFVSHYGHLALISYMKIASAESIIPTRRFQLVCSSRYLLDRPILRFSLTDVSLARYPLDFSILDHNAFFGNSEKTVLVSGEQGLLDMQLLINQVEELKTRGTSLTFRELISEFEWTEFLKIKKPYTDRGYSWFTTIQIRTTNSKDNSRDNSISNLLPLIKYIGKIGGFVIVIGDKVAKVEWGEVENLLDLRDLDNSKVYLVDLAIGFSKYFIGPDSGPNAHAVFLGIPTLRVDGVAPMKNTYTTHAPSISLPKYWTNPSGKRLTWLEVVESELGFCEDDNLQKDYKMVSNSSGDILQSFQELVNLTVDPREISALTENEEFIRVKTAFGGIGSGLISSAFFK